MSGRAKSSKVVSINAHRRAAPSGTTCLGHVTGWSPEKGVLVDYAGNAHGPCPAQCTVAFSVEDVEALVSSRQPVLLTFERDQPDRPIVIGVIQTAPLARRAPQEPKADSAPLRAVVDGKEVLLEGKERIELRCGEASIVLTKAGKILVNGTYISSHSTGVHRIRGGHVELN